MAIFIISIGLLIVLFAVTAFEARAGQRFGGRARERADEALARLGGGCRRCVASEARARACSLIARVACSVLEQFSRVRVRAPGAIISQRATSMMFASRRALVATSTTASPFLRKMAGYKEKKDLPE